MGHQNDARFWLHRLPDDRHRAYSREDEFDDFLEVYSFDEVFSVQALFDWQTNSGGE